VKIKLNRKLGFNVLLASYFLIVTLFIRGLTSPAKAITIYLNHYGEMYFELGLLVVSLFFIMSFIWEMRKDKVINFSAWKAIDILVVLGCIVFSVGTKKFIIIGFYLLIRFMVDKLLLKKWNFKRKEKCQTY
jgi:hypothetical protein